MTPLESFTRLKAVGVSVEMLDHDDIGFYRVTPDGRVTVPDTHATALLCNAVLERWPHWTVERYSMDTFVVYDGDEDGDKVAVVSGKPAAPTRLAALTLAAEAKHKGGK